MNIAKITLALLLIEQLSPSQQLARLFPIESNRVDYSVRGGTIGRPMINVLYF